MSACAAATNNSFVMVGLVPPYPHTGTHPPHADQNNDIVGDTSEIHRGVPTVGLTDTSNNDNATPSHAVLGSKDFAAVPHLHDDEMLEPDNISVRAQCPMQEHPPTETVQSNLNAFCDNTSPSDIYAAGLRPSDIGVVLPIAPMLKKKMHLHPKGLSIPKFTHTLSSAYLMALAPLFRPLLLLLDVPPASLLLQNVIPSSGS